jgi:hypothetical protein
MPQISRDVQARYLEAVQVLIESGRAADDAAVAAKAGLDPEIIPHLRKGYINLQVRHIDALCRAYAVDPRYLFGGRGRPLLDLTLKIDERKVTDAFRHIGEPVQFVK